MYLATLKLLVACDCLATAHAQTLHFGWAYIRVKKPLCKNFEAKEGKGVYSTRAYFRKGTVHVIKFPKTLGLEGGSVETRKRGEKPNGNRL